MTASESPRKVAIIGAGAVGSTLAYTLMRSGLVQEIVIIDLNREKAEGEAMDLNHGLFFVPPVSIRAGDYSDCSGASIIVVTAGAKQKPGESRLDLVQRNVAICRGIIEQVKTHAPDSILIMVANPVDILTYAALKFSGFPRERVMGSGTVLDSVRFRYLISRHCNIDARNVHAYVIGEHGDSEVPVWSMTNIAGVPILKYCPTCRRHCPAAEREKIFKEVRDSAYHIIEYKGATFYAVSLALEKIIQSILRNENSILTVSTLMSGHHGIEDVCLGLPCVVNRKGAGRVIESPLTEEEVAGLKKSASILQGIIRKVDI